ncbi:MAG: class GN sortase, partial [Proteobacteria bacterium]|nr:class GN sortase [Pseudomonadota bacterium]
AKAYLAQYLLADAWQASLKDNQQHKPWSWADTYPVAKLSFPSLNEGSYVLEGANDRNMAFGPARLQTSGMPGEYLSTVISGHNDSHFSFLNKLKINDTITVQTLNGVFEYQISEIKIIDSEQQQIQINYTDELILTTCYPFNSLSNGGTLRYQIIASSVVLH